MICLLTETEVVSDQEEDLGLVRNRYEFVQIVTFRYASTIMWVFLPGKHALDQDEHIVSITEMVVH